MNVEIFNKLIIIVTLVFDINFSRIYVCGNHIPKILENLSAATEIAALKALIIDPLKEFVEDLDKFQQMVEQTIDLEAADKGDFMVKADFDDDLKGIILYFKLI